ncbi:MAG: succinoglycan biosynthesis protein exoa [Devosia sp.]|jgi:succinoglycan biosynthesis protein ExoA|nr:succinoglycan biosynthesis protein exoa [Devosia sp.]
MQSDCRRLLRQFGLLYGNILLGESILVVIPTLNEEAHIWDVLRSLSSDPLAPDMRIVVADGGSTDRTQGLVQQFAQSAPAVRLLRNPQRLQSAGVNLAARLFGGGCRFLVRIDAHASYPPDYVSQLVAAQQQTGANSVVVSMKAVGQAPLQVAIAEAQNSVYGTGGSAHRTASVGRWVEHGHHALFCMDDFLAVGGYNEALSHNEDAELDMRLSRSGRRLYLAALTIQYYPRDRLDRLWRQYFNFGRGRARTALMHRQAPNARRWLVILLLPALALALLTPAYPLAALPLALWTAIILAFAGRWSSRHGMFHGVTAAVAGAIMQLAWSAGFHAQLLVSLPATLLSKSDAVPPSQAQ